MKKYELKINERLYEVVIKNVTHRDIQVEVNGHDHVVEIQSIKNLSLPQFAAQPSAAAAQSRPTPTPRHPVTRPGDLAITAPMPGQIKAIFVREGDRVTVGQKLLIMEAMKLENKINARHEGIVKKILVRDGDTVNQGQELVIIE
jgi:biotin carboxyl carrier protein